MSDKRKRVQPEIRKNARHRVQQHRAQAAPFERVADVDGANGTVLVSGWYFGGLTFVIRRLYNSDTHFRVQPIGSSLPVWKSPTLGLASMTCSNQASEPSCRVDQASLTSDACRRCIGLNSKPTGQLIWWDNTFQAFHLKPQLCLNLPQIQLPCQLTRHMVHQKAILPFDGELHTCLNGQIGAQMSIAEVSDAQTTLPVQQLHGRAQAIDTARRKRVHEQPGGTVLHNTVNGALSSRPLANLRMGVLTTHTNVPSLQSPFRL